ncbi:MAG: cyclic nucleotide-binding domain-containing protein [Alphaproteobacteria bacterium]
MGKIVARIEVTEVTPGVSWIEVAEANLRLLCGCPADVVKHLMRKDLIRSCRIGAVSAETGPNAILLSDTMLQQGEFANLAEFPVLQMLYKQGMLLPGHPNNTGAKPLLIGIGKQLRAQLNYIYRGNYGLVSETELIAAGLDSAAAHEAMRIKLHFAFGSIRDSGELLDCIELDNDRREIRNGVSIRRTGLNCYDIDYGDECITVDLNQTDPDGYHSPYALGAHRAPREYFSVVHSGEGDGWDINRPSMGSLISFQGRFYLVDAGPNLSAILQSLSISVNELEGIFHTHSHDDHFAGLTTLIQADHKLRYFAVPAVRAAVTKKLAALTEIEEWQFETYFDTVDLKPDIWNDVNGLEVMPVMSPHPVETSIFHFRAESTEGYKSYSHLADIAAFRVLDNMVTEDADKPGLTPDRNAAIRASYLSFAHLKKIDIGGGLIHGDAVDFDRDPSDKVVLAHLARPLNVDERQIGSGADFGTHDVLIAGRQDYLRRQAFGYLRSYYPELPNSRLEVLMNNALIAFNPQEILIRRDRPVDELLLILSGTGEAFEAGVPQPTRVAAGELFGELEALRGIPSTRTLRAKSFLHALSIPREQYAAFIDRHGQRAVAEELAEKRDWLRRCWLFRDNLGCVVLNRIAIALSRAELEDGPVPETDADASVLRLVKDGVLKRLVGGAVVETLQDGDFFNEERCFAKKANPSELYAIGSVDLWDIDAPFIADIPIVRWKILELSRRRLQLTGDAAVTAKAVLAEV